MNAEYFEEQRREMVTAIRAITEHMAAELGKTALDDSGQWQRYRATSLCRLRSSRTLT